MKALDVVCPACGRKVGNPCMKLSGVEKWGMWVEDQQLGGWQGGIDCKNPHAERVAAARGAQPL